MLARVPKRRQTRSLARRVRRRNMPATRRMRRDAYALRNQRTGGLLGVEYKFLDTGLTSKNLTAPTDATGGEAPPSTGCTGCLSAPAQGDSSFERDGNKIIVKSCLVQGMITIPSQQNQATADTGSYIYIALVQDTQTNGTQLNSENVFKNTVASADLAAFPQRNISYTQRFRVLKTKTIRAQLVNMVYDGTNVEQQGVHVPFKLSWKGQMPVTFLTGTTTADIANVTNNSLQIVAFCSNTSMAPTLRYNARIRFIG